MQAIRDTKWYPTAGENRIGAMVEGRPDWVLSRQRAWGVPLAIFVHKQTGEILTMPPSTPASPKPSRRKAPMPGSTRRRRASSAMLRRR